ncbi:MAG: class I SAM-dependent methyltransferase [Planctomycetota bacterium]
MSAWWNGNADGPACLVCGGVRYQRTRVLWDGLIAEWGLSSDESEFIDKQQGVCCTRCGCNLRSIALAGAICDTAGFGGTFDDWLATAPAARVLEVNPAGGLTRRLGALGGLVRAAYPEVDMVELPYDDGSFDLVVHSDTLEHVRDPGRAVRECRRVLRAGGYLAMTVPVIPARMTRSRAGLTPSYHGGEGTERADHLVHTEFGADVWTLLCDSGFDRAGTRVFAWPSGISWWARR